MQRVVYAVAVLIGLLLLVGLLLPRHGRVEVQTRIDAHPATVFALVNDFRRYNAWSSLTETDPNVRVVYAGPARGVDAAMTWDGAIIGTGTQIIVASRPFEYVETVMNPDDAGAARTWFELSGENGTTVVSWHFETDYGFNLVGRYFAKLLVGVIERDYDESLVRLKELAESLPGADFGALEIEQLVVEPADIAYLQTTATPAPAAISEAMGEAYFEILTFIDQQGLTEAGAPLSITRTFSGGKLIFDAAIPVRGISDATPRAGQRVRIGRSYGGNVIRVRHLGTYGKLGDTHRKIAAYLAATGIERAGDAWEVYVSDPTRVPEAELLTYVYYPIEL